jgi:hypothetical protein
MALVIADRIKETTTTTGTGSIVLNGAAASFLPFSTLGAGNTTYYAIVSQGNSIWEVGIGTVGSGTLSRDTVLASSNSNAKVTLLSGTKDVFVTLPSGKAVTKDNAVGINSGISLADYVDFDTTAAPASAVGRLGWNNQEGTLDLGLKGGTIALAVGQEQVIRVVNKTGSTLTKEGYSCVKISGAQGQRPSVVQALANNDANSADTIGLVAEAIANNAEGFVCTSGVLVNINTTGSLQGESWNDGDVLYLSGTTAGRLTNIRPQAPIHMVIVGFVIYAHASQGKIFVKVDNGYEIDELHDVRITSVANNNVLRYNSGLAVWENVAQTSLTAGVANTVDNTNSANNLSFWTGTQAQYDALTPNGNTLYFIT